MDEAANQAVESPQAPAEPKQMTRREMEQEIAQLTALVDETASVVGAKDAEIERLKKEIDGDNIRISNLQKKTDKLRDAETRLRDSKKGRGEHTRKMEGIIAQLRIQVEKLQGKKAKVSNEEANKASKAKRDREKDLSDRLQSKTAEVARLDAVVLQLKQQLANVPELQQQIEMMKVLIENQQTKLKILAGGIEERAEVISRLRRYMETNKIQPDVPEVSAEPVHADEPPAPETVAEVEAEAAQCLCAACGNLAGEHLTVICNGVAEPLCSRCYASPEKGGPTVEQVYEMIGNRQRAAEKA